MPEPPLMPDPQHVIGPPHQLFGAAGGMGHPQMMHGQPNIQAPHMQIHPSRQTSRRHRVDPRVLYAKHAQQQQAQQAQQAAQQAAQQQQAAQMMQMYPQMGMMPQHVAPQFFPPGFQPHPTHVMPPPLSIQPPPMSIKDHKKHMLGSLADYQQQIGSTNATPPNFCSNAIVIESAKAGTFTTHPTMGIINFGQFV